MTRCFSPYPHHHPLYLGLGRGFCGDAEKWNWRYLRKGLDPDPHFDRALDLTFNPSMRAAMRQTPAEVYFWVLNCFGNERDMPVYAMLERMVDAQARLFPPIAYGRDGTLLANPAPETVL